MLSLEQRATQLNCLTCKTPYIPAFGCSPAEYPNCTICNYKESQRIANLPKLTIIDYNNLTRPGKRNGKKTEAKIERKRMLNPKKKRGVYLVNKGRVEYEKTI